MALSHDQGQRSSALLHGNLHQLCQTHSIDPVSIKRVVYHAGPGFYTGLRIAYGVAQILKLDGAAVHGFYSHDLPRLINAENYQWITKAYRGEVYVYDGGTATSKLMSEDEFLAQDWSGDVYIHHPQALDERMATKLTHAKRTEKIATEQFVKLLASLENSPEAPLHYFRAPEEEFRPST